ncbi:brefeldin A-inhibited guanine nucleotide-exchange protein 3-like [Glandiceps talaboti]
MEDIFTQLAKDASGSRYKPIREACTMACDTLDAQTIAKTVPIFQLREICLQPLSLALDSKNNKLAMCALGGLQKFIADGRFKSNASEEKEDNQMLSQILKTLSITATLNEELQVEIMKFLLTMTCSESFTINANTILKVSEICIATLKGSHQSSTHTAVKATLTQMLSSISLHLKDRQTHRNEDANDVVAEFSTSDASTGPTKVLCDDVVKVLDYFCKKLENCHRWTGPQSQQLMGLYLECVLVILSSSSTDLRTDETFINIVWQQLCPTLISILGNPKNEKSIISSHNTGSLDNEARGVSDHGRGSGCSATAPSIIHSAAKSVYAIGVQLLRLVGTVGSLRPVLSSLFHRFLLYPPPQHRYEALKAVKEVFSTPQGVLDMAGPPLYDTKTIKSTQTSRNSDLDLLKLLLDGIVESSHSNEGIVCHTSVACVVALLTALEDISQGKCLSDLHITEINKQLDLLDLQETQVLSDETEAGGLAENKEVIAVDSNGVIGPTMPEETCLDKNGSDEKEEEEGQKEEEEEKKEDDQEKNGDVNVGKGEEEVCQMNGDDRIGMTDVQRQSRGGVVVRDTLTYQTDVTGKELCDIKPLEDAVIERLTEDNTETYEAHLEVDNVKQQQDIDIVQESEPNDDSDYVARQQESEDEEMLRKQISAEAEMEKQRARRREELEAVAKMNAEAEKEGARDFVNDLISLLPSLLQLTDASQVDETLLRFASRFCADGVVRSSVFTAVEAKRRKVSLDKDASSTGSPHKHPTMPILNADGIYVATYYALLLNLKLVKKCHYEQPSSLPISEKEFVRKIHDGVFLVYLSSTWLSELYNQVITRNLIGEAGYTQPTIDYNSALMTLLTDIDGLGNRDIGGQMLRESTCQSTLSANRNTGQEQALEAGLKFSKITLVTIWEQVLEVLSLPLATKNITVVGSIAFLLGTEGAKEQSSRDREAIMMSLDGLRKAARLSCTLGVQDRCASVLSQLASASCVYADPTVQTTDPKKQSLRSRLATASKTGVRLHTSHVLSMDGLLNMGLEIGSHSEESWKHVFRCCAYVSQLEHSHFSSGNTQPTVSITKVQEQQQSDSPGLYDDNTGDLDMMSTYSQPISTPIQQAVNIHDIIQQNNEEMGFDMTLTRGGVLSVSNAAKTVYGLSADVDRLFEEAASNLNLQALVCFLRELCKASQTQLFDTNRFNADITLSNPTMPSKSISTAGKLSHVTSLHLFRVADVMLKCVRDDNRPLLHIMQAWGVVAPHFVEAACHKERQVSKKAVAAIHDVLTELLSSKTELPHFNFHESLFKPLESMLCLELCDDDVQDQIVSSICELVEASSCNIKSGWRPLFGTLRAVKAHKQKINDDERLQQHTAPVFDVFEAFLNTDNVFVFANAAIDCVLCLLKFVRGPGKLNTDNVFVRGPGKLNTDKVFVRGPGKLNTDSVFVRGPGKLNTDSVFVRGPGKLNTDNVFVRGPGKLNTNSVFVRGPGKLNTDNVFVRGPGKLNTDSVFVRGPGKLNTDNVFVRGPGKLNTDNVFVRGPGECELISAEDDDGGNSDSSSTAASDHSLPLQAVDLCLPALDYLHRCHKILASIYSMPVCPVFHGAQSIQLNTALLTAELDISPGREFSGSVPTILQDAKLARTQDSFDDDAAAAAAAAAAKEAELLAAVSIDSIDDESGIIRVWFLLLEGLTGAVSTCPRNYQPQTLELLFELLRAIAAIPGPQFAVFAVTNLLLPMLLSWVRRSTRTSYWDTSLANFKHACGLSAELVVDHVVYFVTSDIIIPGVHRMIKQLFDLLVECIGQPMESISRLGCSCIRHVLLRAGPVFTDDMWTIACHSMQQAISVSLHSIRCLMTSFHPGSEDFTGDVGQVKVAARRDCTEMEADRLRQIAQQVFLLDSQFTASDNDNDSDDNRSYIFIMYPPDTDATSVNIDLIKTRIPFRHIVVGLMANQILLQTLGTVLLYVQSNLQRQESMSSIDGPQTLLPGLLSYLSSKNLSLLLECFIESYRTACDFDVRPGLKFLLQKVAKLSVAVNMYRQTALSFTFYLHTLLEICHHAKEDSLAAETVKKAVTLGISSLHGQHRKEVLKHKESNERVETSENGCHSDRETMGDLRKIEEDDGLGKEKFRSSSVSSLGSVDSEGRYKTTSELSFPPALSFHPEDEDDFIWVVKRLLGICYDVCSLYIQLHLDKDEDFIDTERIAEQPLFLLVAPLSPDEPSHKGKKLFSFPPLEKQVSKELIDPQEVKGQRTQWSPKIKAEDTSRLEKAFNIKKDERKLEKKNSREEGKLYTVATNKTIKSLMHEYKKRKLHHSRSTFVKKPTFKEKKVALQQMKKQNKASTPEEQKRQQEIQKQQESSIMRDSEAHMKAWTDMILSMLQLLQLLPDRQFNCLLPATFPAVNQLVCHVTDTVVREAVMEFMERVARNHGIIP